MKREKMIDKILKINLELCYNDSAFNDEFIHDLLRYGFKGLEKMTSEELKEELEVLK
jgi:hypothetical protein